MTAKNRAVFLDRDGTLNRDVGYPPSYEVIEFYPASFEAVRRLNQAGFLTVVVTNQSGIGRGLIAEAELRLIHDRMREDFAAQGATIHGFYYCPHHPYSLDPQYKADCVCRKPRPEMGLRAARDLDIDTARSYMIGDKVEDILFGQNIGARSVLVLTGYGRESRIRLSDMDTKPAHIAETILEAVDWILDGEGPARDGAEG
jgi:D-glycero-D-manno-heptose 1,7-bisphosphate phosphatase